VPGFVHFAGWRRNQTGKIFAFFQKEGLSFAFYEEGRKRVLF
jgi:hypothetical protein